MVRFRTSSEALEKQCRVKIKALAMLVETSQTHLDPQAIHDMRVTVRRVLVMVGILPGRVRDSREARRFEMVLKSLLKATARVRDLDILKSTLEAHVNPVPHEILMALETERKQAESSAKDVMKAIPEQPDPVILQFGGDSKKLSKKLGRRIEKRGRIVDALLAKAMRDESKVEDLHRLRIEVKKLRYLLEVAEGISRDQKVLTRWQDKIGEIHDLDVAISYLLSSYQGVGKKVALRALERARHNRFRAFGQSIAADLKVLRKDGILEAAAIGHRDNE